MVKYTVREEAREMGYNFRAGSLAFQLPNGNFDVYCVTCSDHLGTFTGDILAGAIMHNLDRGGVRCPRCRARTCQFCYVMQQDAKTLGTFFGKDKKVRSICSICTLEMEHSARVLSEYENLDAAIEEIEEDWDVWVERHPNWDPEEGKDEYEEFLESKNSIGNVLS